MLENMFYFYPRNILFNASEYSVFLIFKWDIPVVFKWWNLKKKVCIYDIVVHNLIFIRL